MMVAPKSACSDPELAFAKMKSLLENALLNYNRKLANASLNKTPKLENVLMTKAFLWQKLKNVWLVLQDAKRRRRLSLMRNK